MLRKGAIDASEERKVAIPFNMRDGISICTGRGNEQWLNTAPHGAGRIICVEAAADIRSEVWSQHTTLQRGNPIRTFIGPL